MFLFRNELQHHRVPASAHAEDVILHRDILPSLGTLCGRLMDKVRLTLVIRQISSTDQFHSFLVNPEIIPGRMTLLVTIFLVLINIHNTIQTNSPKVNCLMREAI